MERLVARLPDLDDAARAEVLQTVRRVADKLLHQPTVRVKELANETGAVSYAAALAELFALDPEAVDAVTRPEGAAHDGPAPARHPRLAPRPHPVRDRRRPGPRPARPRGRAGRGHHRGRHHRRPRWPRFGGTGVFVSALRDALLRGDIDLAVHSLKDLPTAPARRHHAGRRARPARTRATSSWPATGSPSASCRSAAGSAPARRAASPSCTPSASAWRSRTSVATSTPASARSAPGSTTPSCSRGPGWPGSAGSTRRPRCSTRCRCSPPPGRVRWRSSAGPATPTWWPSSPGSTTRAPGRPSRPSGPCSPRSRVAARLRSEPSPRWSRATTGTSSGSGPSPCPPTGRCRCGCPHRVPRPTPRASAPGWRARCSPTAQDD